MIERTLTKRRSWFSTALVTLVAVLILIAAWPSTSSAAEYGFQPCGDPDDPRSTRDWDYDGQQMIGLRTSCGQAFYQYFQVPIDSDWGPGLRILPLGPGTVKRLDLVVRGREPSAQGMDFALAVCNGPNYPSDCGVQVRGATDPPYLPRAITLDVENDEIPDGADRLMLYSACTRPAGDYCPATESVVSYSDLFVTADDDTPPDVNLYLPDANTWLNALPNGEIFALDPESGIDRAVFSANDSESTNYFCNGLASPFGCPISATAYDGSGVPLVEGRNNVTIETFNRASLSTTKQLSFLYDSVAPAHPVNLRALDTSGGWLIGDNMRLRWKNTSELVETSTESGISSAIVDIQPSDPPPVWGPEQSAREFAGSGIDSAALTLPWPDTWTVRVTLVDAAGNKSEPEPITIDNEDPFMSPPTINPQDLPIFNIDGTDSPLTIEWQVGNFGRSGECSTRGWIGKGTPPNLKSIPSSKVADAGDTTWTLSQQGLSKLSDGVNTIALAGVDCAGDVSENMTRSVMIDRQRPIPKVEPAARWLPSGSTLTLTAVDPGAPSDGSGVASVWYQIDDQPSVSTVGDTVQIPALAGAHTLQFGAIDSLGNASDPAEPKKYGVDGDPPLASISPAATGLGTFNSVVRDSVSGVVEAWTEISRSGSDSWSRLGDRFVSAEGQTSAVTLGLRVPDDGSLPPGSYDLRVVARDAANNMQTAVARTLQLPLREKASLTASIHAASKPKVSHRSITLDLGAKAGVRGALRDSGGEPIGGAVLRVVAQRDSGGRRLLDEVRTAVDGTYSLPLGTDVSRTLTVSYDGDASRGVAAATVRQNVRAGVSMRLSADRVRRGGRLHASGRVKLLTAAVPPRGVPIEVQFCTRRGCSRVSISDTTDSNGGFSTPIPTAYSGRTKLVLRARVGTFPGWPFAAATSKRRTVVIG